MKKTKNSFKNHGHARLKSGRNSQSARTSDLNFWAEHFEKEIAHLDCRYGDPINSKEKVTF